jgi:hypothetical protein
VLNKTLDSIEFLTIFPEVIFHDTEIYVVHVGKGRVVESCNARRLKEVLRFRMRKGKFMELKKKNFYEFRMICCGGWWRKSFAKLL